MAKEIKIKRGDIFIEDKIFRNLFRNEIIKTDIRRKDDKRKR